jgi:hypothetical protein
MRLIDVEPPRGLPDGSDAAPRLISVAAVADLGSRDGVRRVPGRLQLREQTTTREGHDMAVDQD